MPRSFLQRLELNAFVDVSLEIPRRKGLLYAPTSPFNQFCSFWPLPVVAAARSESWGEQPVGGEVGGNENPGAPQNSPRATGDLRFIGLQNPVPQGFIWAQILESTGPPACTGRVVM